MHGRFCCRPGMRFPKMFVIKYVNCNCNLLIVKKHTANDRNHQLQKVVHTSGHLYLNLQSVLSIIGVNCKTVPKCKRAVSILKNMNIDVLHNITINK